MDESIKKLATRAAEKHRLPPELVLAVIRAESSGEACAVRFEPGFRWINKKAEYPGTCSPETELTLQATSFGLMQVMGAVARDSGFTGWLTELTDPALNLEYGCRHLARFKKRYLERFGWPGVVAAYNAGSPRKKGSGYVNQHYVDRILKNMGGRWPEHPGIPDSRNEPAKSGGNE